MILSADRRALTPHDAGRATLDDLFRRAAVQRPHAVALADPLDCADVIGRPPREMNYIEIDNAASAIATRLRRLGLQTDAVVAYQLPNTSENVLMLLGILRAGMIAAPLPMLWSAGEIVAALARVGASIIVTSAHIGRTDHCAIAMQAAAEHFRIRHVGVFGKTGTDGVVPFDEVLDANSVAIYPAVERAGNPAAHVALVTWETGPAGLVAVARDHQQLLAGARAAMTARERDHDGAILSAIPPSSFAGIALAIVPWLLTGTRLVLHQPFDVDLFRRQRIEHRCGSVLLPGPAIARLAEAGILATGDGLENILALWRSPEQHASAAPVTDTAHITDVLALGEIALAAARRDPHGRIAENILTRGRDDGTSGVDVTRTGTGTLAVRGRMVASAAFPPGAERGLFPFLQPDPDGFVDTGYGCRLDRAGRPEIAGPVPGVIQVGGYRFRMVDLDMQVAAADRRAAIAALPHRLTGHCLAGSAADTAAVAHALAAAHPLIAGAFANGRQRAA